MKNILNNIKYDKLNKIIFEYYPYKLNISDNNIYSIWSNLENIDYFIYIGKTEYDNIFQFLYLNKYSNSNRLEIPDFPIIKVFELNINSLNNYTKIEGNCTDVYPGSCTIGNYHPFNYILEYKFDFDTFINKYPRLKEFLG